MDDEFALCWNNFQDNIASGFQNLFDRGYLVDVTLACDGKLLQAHKIVLAICSPYFQEMFIANPCKHPIIVLKDISSTVMTELLQFMYQGVVNVKHTELSTFMKIAQTLQIKGLATSSTSKSFNQPHSQDDNERMSDMNEEMQPISRKGVENKMSMSTVVNAKADNVMAQPSSSNLKRNLDYEHFTMSSKKQLKRFSEVESQSLNNSSMELSNTDDTGLPPVPQISMLESRFDINNVKREVSDMPGSPGSARNSVPSHFNFDYNVYQSRNIEYPNELHAENDFKGGSNYSDIPAGSNITMLTSTSLLHGNCIFNRNNTVATQQGMKTYWLCKSYRITMCRARCITHQGRIISATGVHNHQPHMKSSSGNEFFNPFMNSIHGGSQQVAGNENSSSTGSSTMSGPPNMRIPQNANSSHNINNQQQQHLPFHSSQQYSSGYHQVHYPSELQGQHNYSSNNAAVLQNMMQNVLSQNNLMHLTNMAPMLNPLSQYSSSVGNSSNSGTKMPVTGDYSTFQQPGRNSDDSHILDPQNMSTTAVDSSNRAGGCSNFATNNSNNSNNKPSNGNENKDNGNSESALSINNNNNSNPNSNPTAMSNTNNNSNNSNTNNSSENGSNTNSGKNSSNNNSSDSIYYGGDSNSNNNENISNSGVGPGAPVVNSTNSNSSNNNNNNVNSDSTNGSNAGSNNENSNNSISSANNSHSTGRAIRPAVNTSVMSVNNTCESVPQISNDLAEANLISISPSQMTFKIERT